ncbi:MBL fold metallo-hydrolase, partial [Sphingobacterium shayense]|nr:MBL fold metallo-hydrolase [Sphingobacterium shayense]
VGGEHYFFGGDVLPEPEEIFKNFIAKYDFDGRKARDLRTEYWEQGRENDWVYLFYHSKSIAIGKAEKREDGSFKIVDVATQ